ncbi:MAG: permease [Chloroflexota bacterium]|nr:MAG: permease [Chloroflexota bacterium]
MLIEVLFGGLNALRDYIALHVLTCLIPAFLLAGGIVTFVRKEVIIGYLGAAARKMSSFGIAAGGSFFVAACSCTVIPVSSGIYHGGAGVGAAFILLWVAPAANILALIYTGQIIGTDMVIARLISVLLMSFLVGIVMVSAFYREERNRVSTIRMSGGPLMNRQSIILLLMLVGWLLAPNYIVTHGPYWHKIVVWVVGLVIVTFYSLKVIGRGKIKDWLKETWWFVRIIFPMLLAGVFIVGIIGALLPQEWIKPLVGGVGLRQSFIATMFGAITYFATMTEAPFVDTLMNLGMGKGPALALLLTGPGLSLPNWLAIARVFGVKKALVYVPTIIVLGTLVGWVAGYILD